MIFFFNDTATTEIYTLSLHDALPICIRERKGFIALTGEAGTGKTTLLRRLMRDLQEPHRPVFVDGTRRSEEHTSELQSRQYLVCRLLLEKKKTKIIIYIDSNSMVGSD